MKPINLNNQSCDPISSNCVIWQGPDIDCINLCKGDSVSDVVFKLAEELCSLLKSLDISNYDLSCLKIQTCAPESIKDLIKLLIERICALENITPGESVGTSGCPNCIVNLAPCFQYTDPGSGDLVTTILLHEYVILIGNTICSLITQITTLQTAVQELTKRVEDLELAGSSSQRTRNSETSVTPVCVGENIPTPISEIVQALERAFCELRTATGTPDQIFTGIASQCSGLNSAPSLGTHGGAMSSIAGWVSTPNNLGDIVNNIWLTLCDVRSALVNIKANCCDTLCNGVAVALSASMPSPSNLLLFFTGSIPSNLAECALAGTLITIADQSGNAISTTIPVKANMNNISGYPIDLSATPINISDDLTISSTLCFKDDETGSVCQSILSYVFINTADCPSVVYVQGETTIGYSFNHSSGPKTYVIELYNSAGTVLLQSQTYPVTDPVTVSGTFSALDSNTIYKVRVKIQTTTKVTNCPFTAVTTLLSSCPDPQNVIAVLTID